jgi:TrmH family RNA methyltransferase
MITSAANPRLRRLKDVLHAPGDAPVFAAEGLRAAEEVLRSGVKVDCVFYSDRLEQTPRGVTLLTSLVERGAEKIHTGEAVLAKVSATEQSQGIVALVHKPAWAAADLAAAGRPVFLLDGVRDPGNLGTIVRIADAFAFGGLALSGDSVEPFNDKVVRSSMGSLLRVPIVRGGLEAIAALLRAARYTLAVADAAGATALRGYRAGGPVAIVLGNEAHGVRPAAAALATVALRIDMPGRAESLNVGVAAGILAYELAQG